MLRLATAGSVDDGKSTLVGRLLYDTKSVLADQIDAVTRASVDKGLPPRPVATRRRPACRARAGQSRIDVAYRYCATPRRSFVLADTPGHVQYTRNTV
ncbi:sulfate adenylyltransferase, partial [Rhodococcus hoagii]|nr:sulfate adenylyltransferase [Prescottella equi]